MFRGQRVRDLAERIATIHCAHPLRVAVDGLLSEQCADAAESLAGLLTERKRPVIQVRARDFGDVSGPNFRAVVSELLLPLGPGGSLRHRTTLRARRVGLKAADFERAEPNAILLLHGCFLQRPQLRAHWDFSVFVSPNATTTTHDARTGASDLLLSAERTTYLDECRPGERANCVIYPSRPVALRPVKAAISHP